MIELIKTNIYNKLLRKLTMDGLSYFESTLILNLS